MGGLGRQSLNDESLEPLGPLRQLRKTNREVLLGQRGLGCAGAGAHELCPTLCPQGSEFGVWGLGFRVQGFKVQGFKVQGFRV